MPKILNDLLAQQDNIKKSNKYFRIDRRMKVYEIAETVNISIGFEHTTLQGHLVIKKQLPRWVLQQLTVDQQQERVDDSERCLRLF